MSAFTSAYWSRDRKRRQRRQRRPVASGGHYGFRPCLRVGCGHDERGHTVATDDHSRELFGACQTPGCYCFRYVEQGRAPAYERMR